MKNPDTLNADYKARPNDKILLTVVVGNAQMGATAVWIDETLHGQQDYDQTLLGTGAALSGHEVRVKTLVADINNFSNKMSVTYTLEGGPAPLTKTVNHEVDEDGESAVFRAIFTIKR